MGKLQLIENKLTDINDAVFQNLCDSYLILRNHNYSIFSRTGSQKGKQKTIKGTPDSFLLLPDDEYIFIEYSTNISKGISKLKEDISKCLDSKKTGINSDQIKEIILCINFSLKTDEVESLKALLKKTNIRLTVLSIDSLAIELDRNHRNLAKEYLGITFDTGQIVSMNGFVKEYNKAGIGIATPLDNDFIKREAEENQIIDSLANEDLIILTGPAGVGKTKLAVEVINQFVKDNPTYLAYGISNKHAELLEDLYQYFDNDNNYVLFIDDANRIDTLKQIVGFYKVQKSNRFKIILTVRDYAFSDVETLIPEFVPNTIIIDKLSDDQIIEIIEASPFEITNKQFHNPIKQIADGNPRLAIMAALLAVDKQDISFLRDATVLFDQYYATFINDEKEFSNKLNLKTLGLIAFFYALPYKDKETISAILSHFDIEYGDFISSIETLDKLELVEIQFEHVKIPEQNMATYFFYRVFMEEGLIPLHVLMNNYFDDNHKRIKDNIIPAFNTFNHEVVEQTLTPHLQKYWHTIKHNRSKVFRFLPDFWFLLQPEAITYAYNELRKLPHTDENEYVVKYETNQFSHNKDELLDLLGEFLRFYSTMKDAMELSIEYVRKQPQHAAELVHMIRERMLFDPVDDWNQGFIRQITLFDYLIKGIKKQDKLNAILFFELAKTFMGFRFQTVKGTRNNAMQMLTFTLHDSSVVQKFRAKIWETVKTHFQQFPELALNFLTKYSEIQPDVVKEVMEYDLTYLIDIINENLSLNKFDHCKYVQHQIRWCRDHDVEHPEFKSLKKQYTNPIYELYAVIDWDRLKDKESYDFDDYKKYEQLKEEQIKTYVILKSPYEVNKFYEDYKLIKSKSSHTHRYNYTLTLIIDETFKRNQELGLYLLKRLIDNENEIGLKLPYRLFQKILNDETINPIFELLYSNEFDSISDWRMCFFYDVPEHLVKTEYLDKILEVIRTTKQTMYINSLWLGQYLKTDKQFFIRLIETMYERNLQDSNIIRSGNEIITKLFDHLGNNLDIQKKFYIQQDQIDYTFDYNQEAFLLILDKDPDFIIEYIENLDYEYNDFKNARENLAFVWHLPDIESRLIKIMNFLNEKIHYWGISNHPCNIFFKNLKDEHKEKSNAFLLDYITLNHLNTDKMDMIMNIIHISCPELFEKALLHYLSLHIDEEEFVKIQWKKTGGVLYGEVNFGDLEAAEWRNILAIIEKADLGIKVIPIKNRITKNIENAIRQGDSDRKRRFLNKRF